MYTRQHQVEADLVLAPGEEPAAPAQKPVARRRTPRRPPLALQVSAGGVSCRTAELARVRGARDGLSRACGDLARPRVDVVIGRAARPRPRPGRRVSLHLFFHGAEALAELRREHADVLAAQ